jgi:two-component system, sensor histidine kinase and response regulator
MADAARIMVVDDEESVSLTMQAVLEQEGYCVQAALSALEARTLLDREQFDVVLLDLRIDNTDGIDLMREVRERQPDCVPIMLTGYASLESAVRAIREGAYDYLVKPCDLDELKLTIARAVERGVLTRTLNERVDDLQAANAKIQHFAAELQQRVDQATRELSEKVAELSEAKTRLEAEQRQREEFISMVAHELAQPLTNISTSAQMLGREKLPEEVKERARGTIVAETRRLNRLVQDLLDATRLAAGHFQVNPAPCDLAEVLREQVQLTQTASTEHRFELDLHEQTLITVCDRDRIAQVLSNILSNAVKYTPGGAVRTVLRREDGRAVIRIADEGPGIPPDRLDAIFQPNVRLVGAGGPNTNGSGLGLYIARGIMEKHGGRIWAENAEGGGAVFTIVLPIGPT